VDRSRSEPPGLGCRIDQPVDHGEQMSVHIVRPSGRHVVWLDKVFHRPVGDQPVERPIPLPGDRPVVEQVDVEAVVAAVADLLWVDRDADPDGPALPGPLEDRPVPTADIQQPAGRPTLNLIQQVVVLIRLGLLERQIGVAVVNPLGQVEQTASREEPIERRIAGYNRPPRLHTRQVGIGRYSETRHAHSIFTQILMSVRNATPPNQLLYSF